MQKFFQAMGYLAITLVVGFVIANQLWPKDFPFEISAINNWAGGIGGLAFAFLSLFVGGSEQASSGVVLNANKFNFLSKNTAYKAGDHSNNTTIHLPK